MKKRFVIVLSVLVVIALISTLLITSLNAASSTHEAEAIVNTLKYAKVNGSNIEFDAKKDAYVEMKSVNSPSSGSATLTFYYSSSKSFPVEIKVNGATIVKEEIFAASSSGQKSFTANMESSANNKIRFKIRDAVSGIKLDKVVIITGGSSSSISPSASSSNPTSSSSGSNTSTPSGGTTSGDITLSAGGDLQNAIDKIQPGKTIYLKSGTYNYSKTIVIEEGNNGSSGQMKNIVAQGSVIIDFSGQSYDSSNRGFVVSGNYWNIKGIKIQKAGDNGMLLSGNNNIIDNCEFYANRDTGLQISRYNTNYSSIDKWPSNNTIKDCYSHSNFDPDNGEDADGFAAKLTSGIGNKFINCIAKYNVDDGWDLYTKSETGAIGSVYFENCEASNNGQTESGQSTTDSDGNGFKLGGSKIAVDHTLVNCKAYNNKKHGFTWNSNPGKLTLINCTASGNGGNDFEKVANQ